MIGCKERRPFLAGHVRICTKGFWCHLSYFVVGGMVLVLQWQLIAVPSRSPGMEGEPAFEVLQCGLVKSETMAPSIGIWRAWNSGVMFHDASRVLLLGSGIGTRMQ